MTDYMENIVILQHVPANAFIKISLYPQKARIENLYFLSLKSSNVYMSNQ